MATKGNTARFAQNPRNFDAIITAALTNVNTDAPTGAVLLVTAGPQGSIIPRMAALLRAPLATTSGLTLFRSGDAGATMRPKGTLTLPVQPASTTSGLIETDFSKFSETRPLRLGPNERLYVGAMGNPPAGGIAVHGDIVDFIE